MIEKLQSHYGFTRTPFGKGLPPQALHRHAAHAEAVARIGWCIRERARGVRSTPYSCTFSRVCRSIPAAPRLTRTRLHQDVTPMDPIEQGMETPLRRLLGRSP